ncbi:MAG: DUF3592 domain-containing protein [Clostridia bacterium]|nr:DUF3592 domain-containing protein [Clostridia bacterium]
MNRIAQFMRDYSFASFFIPLGLILMVMGFIMFGQVRDRQGFPVIPAEVIGSELYEEAYDDGDTHHDATYRITVRYTVDGQTYEGEYGIFPEIKIGSQVRINYNPADPHDIAQPISMPVPLAMLAGSVVVIAASVISILKTREKNKALKKQEEEWEHGSEDVSVSSGR